MTARRFNLEMDGRKVFGIGFDSERELESHLAGRPLSIEPALGKARPRSSTQEPTEVTEPQGVGRPGFGALIDEAIADVGPKATDDRLPLAHRARLVMRQIAQHSDPDSIPAERTVRKYLSALSTSKKVGRNSGQNSGRNSKWGRTGANGGDPDALDD